MHVYTKNVLATLLGEQAYKNRSLNVILKSVIRGRTGIFKGIYVGQLYCSLFSLLKSQILQILIMVVHRHLYVVSDKIILIIKVNCYVILAKNCQ